MELPPLGETFLPNCMGLPPLGRTYFPNDMKVLIAVTSHLQKLERREVLCYS